MSLWLDFGHPESRDKYIKHHCKGRLLQRHPEAVWPWKSLCTVRRVVCRNLNNKSAISFTQILFIMPVLKLSRSTVYISELKLCVYCLRLSMFINIFFSLCSSEDRLLYEYVSPLPQSYPYIHLLTTPTHHSYQMFVACANHKAWPYSLQLCYFAMSLWLVYDWSLFL